MPSVPTLFGMLILGAVVMYGFAFTLIGFVGEALAALALLGLLGRGAKYMIREVRRPKAAE